MSIRSKFIPMGLSPDYCPDWSTWEVAREIAANCLDADPEWKTYTQRQMGEDQQEIDDPNYIAFSTTTTPRIAEVLFLGIGSSRPDETKIGQFGEGFKLAALVATRTRSAKLEILLPNYTITFELRELVGEKILHAKITEAHEPIHKRRNGVATNVQFYAMLTMKGARDAIQNRFVAGDTTRLWRKTDTASPTLIFCKGVFIQELQERSDYHYNLNSLRLNRDRNVPDIHSLKSAIAQLWLYHMTEAMADYLLANHDAFENVCIEAWGIPWREEPKQLLARRFREKYGDEAILATGRPADDETATLRGHRVVHIPTACANLIRDLPPTSAASEAARVPTSTEVIPKDEGYTSIPDMSKWEPELKEIRRLMDILEIPAHLQIFPADQRKINGLCVITPEGCTVWLNERLFRPGQRLERLRTVIHEIAHADRGDDDGTIAFEHSLDKMAGKLAVLLLEKELPSPIR